jgi:hypothetical protein
MQKFVRNLVASVLAATALGAYAQSAAAQSPPNDNFANATVITGPQGSITGSTVGATGETGEPEGSGLVNSVWFRYTPETSGMIRFHGFGGELRYPLSVYAGSAINALTQQGTAFVSERPTFDLDAVAGTTYHIRIEGTSDLTGNYILSWGSGPVAAILPQYRSVQVGTTATAFATILNPTPRLMRNCRLGWGPVYAPAGTFSYQTTNPTTNVTTGTVNTPVDIPAGGGQTFVFGFEPSAEANQRVEMRFQCDNEPLVYPDTSNNVNMFGLLASTTAKPDMVALAASTVPGYVVLSQTAGPVSTSSPTNVFQGSFAVASVNLGVTGDVIVAPRVSTRASTRPPTPPVATVCQTNPTTGQCLAPPTGSITVNVINNATPTFGIFVEASGPIADNALTNRVIVDFVEPGGNGIVLGSTSVAVRTGAPPA